MIPSLFIGYVAQRGAISVRQSEHAADNAKNRQRVKKFVELLRLHRNALRPALYDPYPIEEGETPTVILEKDEETKQSLFGIMQRRATIVVINKEHFESRTRGAVDSYVSQEVMQSLRSNLVSFIEISDTRSPDVSRLLTRGEPQDILDAGALLIEMAIDNQGSVLASINGAKAKRT